MSETETEKPKVKPGAVAPGGDLNGIMAEQNFNGDTNDGRGFIVDFLATGPEGAAKLQFLVPRRPTEFWMGSKTGTVAGHYRLLFGVAPAKNHPPSVKPR